MNWSIDLADTGEGVHRSQFEVDRTVGGERIVEKTANWSVDLADAGEGVDHSHSDVDRTVAGCCCKNPSR